MHGVAALLPEVDEIEGVDGSDEDQVIVVRCMAAMFFASGRLNFATLLLAARMCGHAVLMRSLPRGEASIKQGGCVSGTWGDIAEWDLRLDKFWFHPRPRAGVRGGAPGARGPRRAGISARPLYAHIFDIL